MENRKRGKGEKCAPETRKEGHWPLTRTVGIVVGAIALVVALWWLSEKPPNHSAIAVAREKVRYAMRDPVEPSDPALVRTTENALWLAQVCEGLVRFRADSVEVEPALAESFSASQDQKEWTFRLRKGVRFHDETEFNSRAVHFCFMRLVDPNNPYHIAGMLAAAREIFGDEREEGKPRLKDIQIPDEFTVTVSLTHPDASFVRRLARVEASIMSPRAIQSAAADGQTTIVGTGPMRVKSLREGTGVVLERNPGYWGLACAIREIEFRQVADANERERALREQLCEMAQRFSPSQVSELQRVRLLKVYRGPAMHGCVVLINRSVAPLDQHAVRQALSLAIDRAHFVRSALQGYGTPALNFLPPAIGEVPTTAVLSENSKLDQARDLLRKVGLENGFAVKLLVPKEQRVWNPSGAVVGELLVSALRQVNISVLCEVLPSDEIRRRLESGDFQAALWGLSCSSGDAVDFVESYLRLVSSHSAVLAEDTATISRLLSESRKSAAQQRRAVHERMEQQLLEIMPWIPLFYADQILVASRRLERVVLQPVGMHHFWKIEWLQGNRP